MRVLVTGGAGFIGSHTVDRLLREGHAVRILDNLTPKIHRDVRPSYLPDEAELVVGDVRDAAAWARALVKVDAVYHFAAYQDLLPDFSTFFDVNVRGTALLYEVAVESALDLHRVVVASSQAVYGEGPYVCSADGCRRASEQWTPPPRSREALDAGRWDHRCPVCGEVLQPLRAWEDLAAPGNQYAMSKHAQEQTALGLGRMTGISTVALRYSIVQGARQSPLNAYSGVCRLFCISYAAGLTPSVYEDGQQLRDYVNVADVVEANLLVLDQGEPGSAYNVGGESALTVLEFAEIVRNEVCGEPAFATGLYRVGDTRHIACDTARLRGLGWRPRRTPVDSVREYLEWTSAAAPSAGTVEEAKEEMLARGVLRPSS
jgi:dTDP-L-rhamnose 4-epimerase